MSDAKHDAMVRLKEIKKERAKILEDVVDKNVGGIKHDNIDKSIFKKNDLGKEDLMLVPEEAMLEVVKVLMFGANRYGKFNWLENSDGVNWSRFANALERHYKKFKLGIDYDDDSKLYELAHVIANALFLLTYQINELGTDDRDYRLGKEIGKLKCIKFIKKDDSHRYYEFECGFCGATFVTSYNNVKNGNTKSCGCQHYLNRPHTHGKSEDNIYNRWRGILARCEDETAISYPNYGGRGIKVCDRWKTFENFYADMGEPPNEDMQIDRIDNDGEYSPENCQWISRLDNIRKQSRVRKFTINGAQYTVQELAEKYNLHPKCLSKRLKMGWELHEALNTPSKTKNK